MRSKAAAFMAVMLLILCAGIGLVQAEATLTPSTTRPVTGEQISFDVGTTLSGLEAVISTTGLTFVSNTGLGNSNHVITVPGISSVYTYTVSAQPGETVSFILSDVREADENGDEREGQRAVWMATASAPDTPSPSPSPSDAPSTQPSDEPSGEPSSVPSDQQPTPSPTGQPSGEPSVSQEPSQPTISGNPSPTVNPSNGGTSAPGGNVGGGSGTISSGDGTGGSSGSAAGTVGGSSQNMPRTGDMGHFWTLIGIICVLILIVIVAGKRVFAED